MKPLILIIASTLISASLIGQNNFLNKNVALKLYINQTESYSFSPFAMPVVSGAIIIPTKVGNFHEVELSGIKLTNDETFSIYRFNMRYEYNLVFRKNTDHKFIPSIGFGTRIGYRKFERKTDLGNMEKYAYTSFGLKPEITPRLTYSPDNNWMFDINMPISVLSLTKGSHSGGQWHSPLYNKSTYLTAREKIEDALSLRIGVAYKIKVKPTVTSKLLLQAVQSLRW